jgi:MerC mercury resistance protein
MICYNISFVDYANLSKVMSDFSLWTLSKERFESMRALKKCVESAEKRPPRAGEKAPQAAENTMLCYNLHMQLQSPSENPSKTSRGAFAHFADRLGAVASFLCAVHCAALPFVLALLPALGLGFLADHGFERGFIVCASLLALGAIVYGYRRHHTGRAFAFLLPGLALLWAGGFVFDAQGGGIGWHSLLVALGGSCVALAHLTNLRLAHGHEKSGCCEHHPNCAIV